MNANVMVGGLFTWRPIDSSDMDYISASKTNTGSIAFRFSGLTSGTPLTFQYVLNYEFIPSEGFTDTQETASVVGGVSDQLLSLWSKGKNVFSGGQKLARKLAAFMDNGVISALSSGATVIADPLSISSKALATLI
jgi:hypothetical protein